MGLELTAFTTTRRKSFRQLVNKVTIEAKGKSLEVYAQWDTGAMGSLISKSVADYFGFGDENREFTLIHTPSGEAIYPLHHINVKLPNDVYTGDMVVSESDIGNQHVCVEEEGGIVTEKPLGMLIGMDIITRGDFAERNFHDGITEFSFRMPSLGDIDFVAELNKAFPNNRK